MNIEENNYLEGFESLALPDVTILCGSNSGVQLQAHSIMLGSRSTYFLEELNRGCRQISVKASESEMRAIFNFIYKGRVCLSKLFDIQKVNNLAKTFMIQNWITLVNDVPELPTELMVKIFSYMTTYDSLKNVSPVCKRFHDIVSSHPDVFKVIQIVLPHSDFQYQPWNFLFKATSCVKLSISLPHMIQDYRNPGDHLYILDEVHACIPNHKHLKVFDVGDGIALPEKYFTSLIRRRVFTKLSELRVQVQVQVGSASRFDSHIAALSESKTLTRIDFHQVLPFETRHFVQLALGCSRLKSISPSENFNDEDWRQIIRARQQTLETLTMNEEVGKEVEFTDFSLCHKLRHLSFTPYYNTFSGILKLSNLKHLEIKLPGGTANCQLEQLPQGSLPQLTSLSVSGGNNDVDVSRTLSCICAATNLESLHCKLIGPLDNRRQIRSFLACIAKIGSRLETIVMDLISTCGVECSEDAVLIFLSHLPSAKVVLIERLLFTKPNVTSSYIKTFCKMFKLHEQRLWVLPF